MTDGNRTGFQVWLRRADAPEAPFSLRFEVQGGKGILRVARPGVLIDPPARPGGTEERLTGAQLRQSRFLHIRDGGRERLAFGLSRLEDPQLDRLPAGEWIELTTQEDGAARFLVLGVGLLESEDDDPTNPARSMLRDFSRDLRQIVERTRPPVAGEDEELLEADSFTAEEPIEELLAAHDGEDDDDPFTDVGGGAPPPGSPSGAPAERGTPKIYWSQAPVEFDAGAWDVEAYDEAGEHETTSPNPAVAEDPRSVAHPHEPPPPPRSPGDPLDPALLVHPRSTTLVRHFRRRIAELEGRIERLEAELAEARAGR